MIKVRTDNNFYLQYHVIAFIFSVTIYYLDDKSADYPIF